MSLLSAGIALTTVPPQAGGYTLTVNRSRTST